MSDKKRKNDPEEAVQPEGKKARKEEKKEKKEKKERKEKAQDVVEEVKEEKKEKKEKKDKKEKKEKKVKAEEQEEQEPEPKEEKAEKKAKKEKKEKKDKKEKKEKRDVNGSEEQQQEAPDADAMDVDEQQEQPAKEKKSKKDKKSKKEKKEKTSDEQEQEEPTAGSQPAEKQNRFIVFVGRSTNIQNTVAIHVLPSNFFPGNLPYSANAESLKNHFAKNPPASVRVATEKEKPTKCRGFGFIEFDHFDRMKTCLKLYHHSMFDDGKYPPRRINVELTYVLPSAFPFRLYLFGCIAYPYGVTGPI
ncbi:hypothetical protein P170DRAFT_101910 [Aspergillus steynii IBT 23096]|uniref:RRM domain-containing protein n=1 Tax=Aspergillus steynii IBT 23096 TaxID=1392250 RepID=A0A2I2GHK5_9EURO|nr:uncharacterized protein P170DRAFT_101910 [Aspergillus steynii IBT 23096]PLB52362.1 hypothetical protein P170DRAFT_101910 [Aspergillus steynii IBT 23096]